MASVHKPIYVAVVDDDWRVVESLSALLTAAGHEVRGFSSAAEFLDETHLEEVGCVISDVGMPVMDGFELRSLLRDKLPKLPVILISGRIDRDHSKLVGEPEACFFVKPFDNSALLRSVRVAIGGYAGRG